MIFAPDELQWSSNDLVEVSYSPRFNHIFELVGHKCYLFGGTRGGVLFNDMHILDLQEFKQRVELDVKSLEQKKKRNKATREDEVEKILKKEKRMRKEAEKEKNKVQKKLKETERKLKEAESYIDLLTPKLQMVRVDSDAEGMEADSVLQSTSNSNKRVPDKALSDEENMFSRKTQRLDLFQRSEKSIVQDIVFPHEVVMAAMCTSSAQEKDYVGMMRDTSFFEQLSPPLFSGTNNEQTLKPAKMEVQEQLEQIYKTLFGEAPLVVNHDTVDVVTRKLDEIAMSAIHNHKLYFGTTDESESMKRCMDQLGAMLRALNSRMEDGMRQHQMMKDAPVGPVLLCAADVERMLKTAEFISLYCFHSARFM